MIRATLVFLIVSAIGMQAVAEMPEYPYSKACAKFRLKRPTASYDSAAAGVGARAGFEAKGERLHQQGRWADSNCLLIHALNISTDHALRPYELIGFNYVALGNDSDALEYLTGSTAYDFDWDTWVEYKKKPIFSKALAKPIYKQYEESLRAYHERFGQGDQ